MHAITGATGAVGSRVARLVAARGAALRLVVRDPSRVPADVPAETAQATYGDRAAMTEALDGTDTLFLVSARETADRVAQHRTAVAAAVDAGVRRIVYLSFLDAAAQSTFTFARDHWATEQAIRDTGCAWTFLRPSLYADLVGAWASHDGIIAGPAGEGRVAWVCRDDVAEAAAEVLTRDGHAGATYDLTGPRSWTLAETAALLGELAGRPVVYEEETLEQARASRASYGAPAWEVEGWVTSYAAIANGELSMVSNDVARLTGHPATGLEEWLRAHPHSWDHLVPGA